MGPDYPEDLLAREPAPRYEGEGAFALWHFSEDPSLGWFYPRKPPAKAGGAAAGVGGRHPSCAHVLVPEGLPARMHLARLGHHA